MDSYLKLLHRVLTLDLLDRLTPITDSVIRESLRLDSIDTFSVQGSVTPAAGLSTPEGRWLPQGTRVALHTDAIHRSMSDAGDGQMDSLRDFDPYRHCKPYPGTREELAYEVSEQFLPFSLGPHACPGRWLGVSQVKIALSVLLTGYDIELIRRTGVFTQKFKIE